MPTYIPQHLDQHLLILGLPIDEFLVSIVPSGLGFILGHGALGLSLSFAAVYLIRRIKEKTANWSCRALAYRYLPSFNTALVPSHWRRFGG